MTQPTPQELDRLEQQANVRLQWIKDVRDGREVKVEHLDCGEWFHTKTPAWAVCSDYRLIYPEAKKREPKLGDKIMVRDFNDLSWYKTTFGGFSKPRGPQVRSYSGMEWDEWKFPDDPDPVPAQYDASTHYLCGACGKVHKLDKSCPDDRVITAPISEPKKRVPLTAEDWKGVWWVREGIDRAYMVTTYDATGIGFVRMNQQRLFSFTDLIHGGWLRSQDGVTWSECSKLSEEV